MTKNTHIKFKGKQKPGINHVQYIYNKTFKIRMYEEIFLYYKIVFVLFENQAKDINKQVTEKILTNNRYVKYPQGLR